MTSDPLAGVDPRALGAQLRGAREDRGWTQQQLAEGLGVAGATVEAIERGERRLEPRELMAVSSLLGRRVSDLLQGWRVVKEPAAHSPDDKPCSPRFRVLAIKTWQREELSEGQLARILCTDRVGAREAIERFQAAAQETKETRVRRLGEDGE